jgi:xanthine dehydrogenase accessory factor
MKNIYLLIPEFQKDYSFAIATVIEAKGSTPQKPGSSALFNPSGIIAGTVGGGVLEGKVQQIAIKSIQTKASGIYQFDLDHDISFKQDAICGGHAYVLIDGKPDYKIFGKISESLHKRQPGVLITIVRGIKETSKKIKRFWITSLNKQSLPQPYLDLLDGDINKLLSGSDPFRYLKIDLPVDEGEEVIALMEPVIPSSQLIIAGAGHIGKALAHIGKLIDFEVTVIDDRIEYANKTNVPDADNIVVENIGKALTVLEINSDTYLVIVTRGHNDDASALKACINSDAAYVGMIGSKTKTAMMKSNFLENGWATEQQWSAVHTPIGLDINSKTVEEIAVSIAAQLILVRNSKT